MANENFDNIAWKEYILKGEEIFDNLNLKDLSSAPRKRVEKRSYCEYPNGSQ